MTHISYITSLAVRKVFNWGVLENWKSTATIFDGIMAISGNF